MNLSTILINMTLSLGLLTTPATEQDVNSIESISEIAMPITKMEGYERYLNDPAFDLSTQRHA